VSGILAIFALKKQQREARVQKVKDREIGTADYQKVQVCFNKDL
jgi:hypothetical protein